jgi:hypothetical protein
MAKTLFCWLHKSGVPEPKVHRAAHKETQWSDGSTRLHIVPGCGARVDLTALESEWARDVDSMSLYGEPCKRCFPATK